VTQEFPLKQLGTAPPLGMVMVTLPILEENRQLLSLGEKESTIEMWMKKTLI